MPPLLRRRLRGRMESVFALGVVLAGQGFPFVGAMIHSLAIKGDSRNAFQIETFSFHERGFMNLTVSGFSMEGPEPYRAGLIVRKTETEISAQEYLEDIKEDLERGQRCLLDEAGPGDLVLELTPEVGAEAHAAVEGERTGGGTHHADRRVGRGDEGLYVLMYCTCPGSSAVGTDRKGTEDTGPRIGVMEAGAVAAATSTERVPASRHLMSSFKLKVAFWNEGVGGTPDYLPAGSGPLPKLFFGMFCLFLGALMMWVHCMRKHPAQVHNIHYLMAVLLVFKTLSMLFESIRYHYLRLTGAAEAWSIVYYLFAFLKGITLFVVILLIGMGWSLIKPILSGRDKRAVFVVLSLQVVNNVAQIVLEETAPGSVEWLEWRRVLHVMDILCCCFVLIPIVWSIRHLRQASLADGKAEHTIRRLKVFTQFYQMVLLYLYFTRIIVVLISAVLPFELSWVQTLASELATLVFFVFTGWRFRPQPDAAYIPLSKHRDESGKLMTLGVATLRSTIMSVPWRVLVDILDDGEAFLIVISPKKHLTHNHENGDAEMGDDDAATGLELQESQDFGRHLV